MCNNSPTECTSPENGWRLSLLLILYRVKKLYFCSSRRTWRFLRRRAVKQAGKAFSADLGASSNYSNENFEDCVSKGFEWTVLGLELVGPKPLVKPIEKATIVRKEAILFSHSFIWVQILLIQRKGRWLKFHHLYRDILAATQKNLGTWGRVPRRVVFSF